MINTHQTYAGAQMQAVSRDDPHDEISWQEVKDLGLDPAPAGLADDDETHQG